jgi:hypothetical protein
MPRYVARAEFRREDRSAPWVLAGVVIAHRFWGADIGVEPISRRLPVTGLVAWTTIPTPIVAADEAVAADAALSVARATWPARDRRPVPFASNR